MLVDDPLRLLSELRPGQAPRVLIMPRGERLARRARRPRTTATVASVRGLDVHEESMLAADRLGRALACLAGADRGVR
jgi:hypothetical protein